MTTITIQIPGKAKNKLIALVKELDGEIVSVSIDKKATKKNLLLDEIKQGIQQVKKIREGTARAYTMSDLFDVE